MGCFDNIIGYTRKDCECYETDRPADYDTSESGLYLDELEGLNINGIYKAQDCGDPNIWTKLENSVTSGINKVETALLSCLQGKTVQAKDNFQGVLGNQPFNDLAPTTGKTYAGVKIETYDFDGGYLIIKGVNAYFSDVGTVTAMVYEKFTNKKVAEFDFNTVDSTANGVEQTILNTPIELPLWKDYCKEFEYYIIYEFDANNKPLNNKFDCGCGGKKPAYNRWIDIDGYSTSDLTFQNATTSDYSYGMNLIVEFKCKSDEILCKSGYVMDFSNAQARIIAEAVRYAAAEHLLADTMADTTNKYTYLTVKEKKFYIQVYRKELEQRIRHLCMNIKSDNDCFVCKRNQVRGQIYV